MTSRQYYCLCSLQRINYTEQAKYVTKIYLIHDLIGIEYENEYFKI